MAVYIKISNIDHLVIALQGQEAISQPFSFDLTLYVKNYKALTASLHQKAQLIFKNNEGTQRVISGIISQLVYLRPEKDKTACVNVHLVPLLEQLKKHQGPQWFIRKRYTDIIHTLLNKAGYLKQQMHATFDAEYPVKDFTLQCPSETDFAYLHRLLSQGNMMYWFSEVQGVFTLHLSDHWRFYPILSVELVLTNKQGLLDEPYRIADCQITVDHQQLTIRVKSETMDLCPGQIVAVDLSVLSGVYNGDYVIKAITHQADAHRYQNTLTLIPRTHTVPVTLTIQPKAPALLPAKIYSPHEHALLDQKGFYRVIFDDDTQQQISEPLPKLTSLNLHFPLQNKTPVVVGLIESDPNQPIIVGGFTRGIAQDHQCQTRAGHVWRMPDNRQPAIDFQTPNGDQSLQLRHATQAVAIQNHTGSITFEAKRDYHEQIDGDRTETVAGYKTACCSQDLTLRVDQTHRVHCAGDLRLRAQQALTIESEGDLQFQTDSAAECTAQTGIAYRIQGDRACFKNASGDLALQAKHEIRLSSQHAICLTQGKTAIMLDHQGVITLSAPHLSFHADRQLALHGEIAYEN